MSVHSAESNLQKEKDELRRQYDELHTNYNILQSNYEAMVKRISQIEAQKSPSTDPDPIPSKSYSNPSSKKAFSNEISQMKGDALNACGQIADLQDVWSRVESKLDNLSVRLDNVEQHMRKNTLFVHGLDDIPKKTYGIAFSEYVINKLKELLPSIADQLNVKDVDVSHPLPTRNNKKTCVIVKFVRRDIKNLIFFKKRELKNCRLKIAITEHLTGKNLWYLDEARSIVGYNNAWSSQCVVYALVNGKKVAIKSSRDLNYIAFNIKKRMDYYCETNPALLNTTDSGIIPPPQTSHVNARDSVIDTVKNMTHDTTTNPIEQLAPASDAKT